MARLHEFQGKQILLRHGFKIPRGSIASTPAQAESAAAALGVPCVVKIQAWTTGRAALGGVGFADTPSQARAHAARMLSMQVGNFPVEQVLVEERIDIARELFLSLSIDDRARAPSILLALRGGTGIEDRSAGVIRFPCDPRLGPSAAAIDAELGSSDLEPSHRVLVRDALIRLFAAARAVEARSFEINPLAITRDQQVVAADCRLTVDDYAVVRHPELGIEIARELDHPPTALETAAYAYEQADHRGTFYFAQMNRAAAVGSRGLIGFHGAGGGGSMMAMDAVAAEGFTLANFCDTSGNPSPAKVYRAARVILAQPGLVGYFGSGSGVANQEQFWSAYGLAKAFWELGLDIPAVIRLGGNTEDRAVDILHAACGALPARVEGYKKNDPPSAIARRFRELVESSTRVWSPRPPRRPGFVGAGPGFAFKGGRVWIDPVAWAGSAPAIVARASGLLRDDAGRPALTLSPDDFAAKDSEMIACEVECRRDAIGGEDGAVFVELEMPGLP